VAEAETRPTGGILDSVRQLGATFVGLLHTRIEIVANEIEEERVRLRQGLLLAIVAGFSLAVAALLAVMFLVVLFWDTHRLVAMGVLFLVFFGVGAGCVLTLVRHARSRPRLFATTLGELAKDGERLRKSS
jgi:uncharacterized membrane protein YqjE